MYEDFLCTVVFAKKYVYGFCSQESVQYTLCARTFLVIINTLFILFIFWYNIFCVQELFKYQSFSVSEKASPYKHFIILLVYKKVLVCHYVVRESCHIQSMLYKTFLINNYSFHYKKSLYTFKLMPLCNRIRNWCVPNKHTNI